MAENEENKEVVEKIPKTWKDFWKENYEGKGDCEELEKRVKHLKTKQGEIIASYLPWAIVERIFNMQDGEIEIIRLNSKIETVLIPNPRWKGEEPFDPDNPEYLTKNVVLEQSIVEVDKLHIRDEYEDDGVVVPKYMACYFVNINAKWKGREYTERYPLLSSTNQPLSHWTQADLNRAVQRGKVKAIAVVSGIGYKLFEDGDLQFEEENKTDTQTAKPKGKKEVKEVLKSEPKPKAKPTKKEEPKPTVMDNLKEPEEEPKVVDNGGEVTESREEMENEIKQQFLKGGASKATKIKEFLKAEGAEKIQSLTEEKLTDLYLLVK